MNENKNFNLILCHSMANLKMLTIQIWKYITSLNYEINENHNYNYLVHYDNFKEIAYSNYFTLKCF